MEEIIIKNVPDRTKERLILINLLLEKTLTPKITSGEIALALGVKDSLIRRDLCFVDCPKGIKNGYSVKELNSAIKKLFNSCEKKELKKCCVVGLGRLGAALLDDELFFNSGFKIEAGFDSSVNRVELLRSTFELYPATKIETVCIQKKIEYAFLCCKESETEKMISRLENAKIKGIVNYTSSVLKVKKEIKVQNVSPIMALMNLGF